MTRAGAQPIPGTDSMPSALINGVPIYWERAGEVGDPLVLLHGSWIDRPGS